MKKTNLKTAISIIHMAETSTGFEPEMFDIKTSNRLLDERKYKPFGRGKDIIRR